MTEKSSSNDSKGEEELSLPENLVKLIDERREELTRTEFIELCVKLSIGEKKQELEKYSGPSINRMSENFEKRLRQLSENMDKRILQISEEMTNRFDYISEVVDKTGEKSSALQRSTESLEKRLEQLSSSIELKYDGLAQEMKKAISSPHPSSSISEGESELVEKRLEMMEENLSNSLQGANDRIDRKLQSMSDMFEKKFVLLAERLGQPSRDQPQQTQSQVVPRFPFSGSQVGGEGMANTSNRGVPAAQRQILAPSSGSQPSRTGLESNAQFDAIMTSMRQLAESIDKKIDRKIDERLGTSTTQSTSSTQKPADPSRKSSLQAIGASSSNQDLSQVIVKPAEVNKVPESPKKDSSEGNRSVHRSPPGDKFLTDSNYVGLWLLAIATFGVGDITTAYFALNQGLTQVNPLIGIFGNFFSYFVGKVAIVIAVFLISYLTIGKKIGAYAVPLVLSAFGLVLTIYNMEKIGWI